MANTIAAQLNTLTSHFSNTPHGIGPGVIYGKGLSYRDNSNAKTALVPTADKHTEGEKVTHLVPSTFISVSNPSADNTKGGVTFLAYSPLAITNYVTNDKNELVDRRCYIKCFFSGIKFLKFNEETKELTP